MKKAVIIGLMLFAPLTHANFTLHSTAENACEQISGLWVGSGSASNWAIGECVYHGLGTASSLDSAGQFTIEVTADKESGTFLCPEHTTTKLGGICVDGVVTVITEYGNLLGNYANNTGAAKGTITVSPGIYAEVSIAFERKDRV